MSSTVFEVLAADGTWHNYSRTVRAKGLSWNRTVLLADSSEERTLDKKLHPSKITDVRNLSFQLMPDRKEVYAALDTDLQQVPVTVKYADLHGITTKAFICRSFSANLDLIVDNHGEWSAGSFTLEEV